MNFVVAFIGLLAGHYAGDFLFQTDSQSKSKPDRAGAMLGHIVSYGAAQFGALLLLRYAIPTFDPVPWQAAAGLVFSLTTHWFIDLRWPVIWWQNHTGSAAFVAEDNPLNGRFHTDQAMHIVCIFLAAAIIGWGSP